MLAPQELKRGQLQTRCKTGRCLSTINLPGVKLGHEVERIRV